MIPVLWPDVVRNGRSGILVFWEDFNMPLLQPVPALVVRAFSIGCSQSSACHAGNTCRKVRFSELSKSFRNLVFRCDLRSFVSEKAHSH